MIRRPPRSTLFPSRRSSDLIFDPTDSSNGPTPERFWKVKPFQSTDVKKIEEILVNLATGADPVLRQDKIGRATSELQSRLHLVCRLLLEKKKKKKKKQATQH